MSKELLARVYRLRSRQAERYAIAKLRTRQPGHGIERPDKSSTPPDYVVEPSNAKPQVYWRYWLALKALGYLR